MPDGLIFKRHVAGGQRVETWMMRAGGPVLLESIGPSDDTIAFWDGVRDEEQRRDARFVEGLTLLAANAKRTADRAAAEDAETPPIPSATLPR